MTHPGAMIDIYDISETLVTWRNALHFRLSAKGPPEARRIFVIGHPRTGTTSLHRFFTQAGLTSIHTAGNWHTDRAECFSDKGQNRPIAALDGYYREAQFVLNCRPVAKYLLSLSTHYNRDFSELNYRRELARRMAHFDRVLTHFADRPNLTVINIERLGALEFLAGRLHLTTQPQTADKVHNRGKRPANDLNRARVSRVLEAAGATGQEPLLIKGLSAPAAFSALDALQARGQVLL